MREAYGSEKEKMNKQRHYRGIPINGKDFVYGDLIHSNSGRTAIIPTIEINPEVAWKKLVLQPVIEVIPETVGQFTGLKDKKRTKEFPKGQEIYGGDIIQDWRDHNYEKWTVMWWFEQAQFVLCNGSLDIEKAAKKEEFNLKDGDRIIGNIHQNPKLLENNK